MPYKITNVALDHRFAAKRARAQRLQMEPIVAGKRLRLRGSVVLSDKLYEHNKKVLKECCDAGVLTVDPVGGAPAPKDPPAPAVVEEPAPVVEEVVEAAPELTPEPEVTPEPAPEPEASETKPAKKGRGRRKSK